LEEYIGVVLKKISYKESSEIIYLYTEKGLISVLVHGSMKMKSPYLNLTKVLNYVKVFVSGKNLKVLRDAEVIINFSSLANDIEKYTYSLHMMELVYYFSTHEHDHEKLLGFLIKVLEKIKLSDDYIPYIYSLELKLLFLLGVNPNLNCCLTCSSLNDLVFSVKDGSVFCQEHKPESYYDVSTVNLIKKIYYYDINKNIELEVDKSDYISIRNLIDEYYEFHLNYRSKSRKILKGLIGY
jgi:DNA repair protein RecO (recombination protein O)